MRILITGVHGFVGSNLVKYLAPAHTLYGLDIIAPEKEGVPVVPVVPELPSFPAASVASTR